VRRERAVHLRDDCRRDARATDPHNWF
jgi:hypothetical protein